MKKQMKICLAAWIAVSFAEGGVSRRELSYYRYHGRK